MDNKCLILNQFLQDNNLQGSFNNYKINTVEIIRLSRIDLNKT